MMLETTVAAPALDTGGNVDFAALSQLRRGLGALYDFVQAAAGEHGCSVSMYQLLLAVKTARPGAGLDIGMIATALGVRHPSAAEMVRKAEAAGFVSSSTDSEDRRRVLVELTDQGDAVLCTIAHEHVAELRRLRPAMIALLRALD